MKTNDRLSLALVLIAVGIIGWQFYSGNPIIPTPPKPQTEFQRVWAGNRDVAQQTADTLDAVIATVKAMPTKPTITELAAIVKNLGALTVSRTGKRNSPTQQAALAKRLNIQTVDVWLAEAAKVAIELRGVA